jgi:hypothetical protein
MNKKEKEKDLLEKTTDEVIADIFHPKVAEHLRKHIKKHEEKLKDKNKQKQ